MPGLQGALQVVTHSLPLPIQQLGTAILGETCYTTLIHDVSPTSACLRLFLSKGLGLGIILFGSILKLPQIVKIVRASSGRGISLAMYSLEVVAYTISLAYAYRRRLPFSTYGENASLTVQNMAITLLLLYYAPAPNHLVRFLPLGPSVQHRIRLRFSAAATADDARRLDVALAGTLMVLCSFILFHPTLLAMPLLSLLQATTIPVSLLSKVPQMQTLHASRDPGQLSSIVVFAQLAGTLARVYTTRTETDDALLLWGFGLASIFNAVIAAQYIYYSNGGGRRPSTAASRSSILPSLYSARKEKADDDDSDAYDEAGSVLREKEMFNGSAAAAATTIEIAIDRGPSSPAPPMPTPTPHAAWRDAPRRDDHKKSRLD
ncbi:hypothetical protein FA10DRAFT_259461 [Acaromyces ingoldii]|uniref:Mannose-P-dolichol utilization defect 1 protein homolog n=1 Tax=Acaromyces ingoldii TaxID=215250 RepID=A0A316YSY6_9BASI|nr:hypothetical protein FA10DRAFT_259461 [Acaromyces ingoldii]PWN92232.1 hypothetical protein FA10DRAFT_259461 [Acaromyces ingoldii]